MKTKIFFSAILIAGFILAGNLNSSLYGATTSNTEKELAVFNMQQTKDSTHVHHGNMKNKKDKTMMKGNKTKRDTTKRRK